ncbi:FHA domain-containing protein [Streptomyces radicis]|uniref:FHA domain-containing protein n=1 Tax=Streptomyces radicis TaxID=1750517 RepID=A0A3A9W2H9_9ACTN|nr:FHA domain-containing protein [Streptomyces radicis]RKN07049.1 FHA domain-containing protein [Streptomyces radicis]RKN15110.1 FHA domain-containing protein [Streptomyces radicis]
MNRPRSSLAHGAPPARPGTLHARSLAGTVTGSPEAGRIIRFGRGGGPDADLRVGEDDPRVSRRHGELAYRRGQWWLRNTGQQLLRLPRGQMMHVSTEPIPLAAGYTPVFVKGSGFREHLVELHVTDHGAAGSGSRRGIETLPPKRWSLADDQRLILVVLGQEYLRYEPHPRPLTYRQAAAQLSFLCPEESWGESKIAHRVEKVRTALEASGDFPYDLREQDPRGASDNTLKHNLLRGLVESTTLVPPDLDLLDRGLDEF